MQKHDLALRLGQGAQGTLQPLARQRLLDQLGGAVARLGKGVRDVRIVLRLVVPGWAGLSAAMAIDP